jgi:hypothetical protein
MEEVLSVAIFWILPTIVGHFIGEGKNRAGWAWGLLLGWLGVIILVCLKPKKPKTLPTPS